MEDRGKGGGGGIFCQILAQFLLSPIWEEDRGGLGNGWVGGGRGRGGCWFCLRFD